MIVLNKPVARTNFGSVEFGLAVKMYHRNTRANLGPEVIAIKIWKTERSGYRSPMVEETDGNHSCG